MWICHPKEIRKLRGRANARSVSFRICSRCPIHIINAVDKTKLFCYTPHRRVFLLPLDGMLVHCRATPQQFAGTHLYTWVEKGTVRVNVLPKNTTQCPRPGLEPGPLSPESSALTMRPPRLPQKPQLSNLLTMTNSHYNINAVDKTKLCCNTPHRRSTSFFTNLPLLFICFKQF